MKLDQNFVALCQAWKACSKSQRSRFLRALRAEIQQAKARRRDERERALADKINRENERRGFVTPPPDGRGGPSRVIRWWRGLPIIWTPPP